MKYLCVLMILTFIFLYIKILCSAAALNKKTKPSYAVITVRNMENCIEGLVKEFKQGLKSQSNQNKSFITKLYIVDLGSTDSTLMLLNLLARNNTFLQILTEAEYEAMQEINNNAETI